MDEELEYGDIVISDEQEHIGIEETVEVIEVFDVPTYEIDTMEAFSALGEPNEGLKHQLLNGKELPDQHPITAITGLREELDDIESLKTVYSDKRYQANYYLWEDGNTWLENRVGYFVSACSDINQIKLCTYNDDIFGVTVDDAGFIGTRPNIGGGTRYGLVVTTGIAHVRCESSVNVGDYVISNNYGYARTNENGYKVVGRHQIDGVDYAEITLSAPINRLCKLSDDVEAVNQRMDDAEINIVAAMNVANEAYNKAGEVVEISEEAIKNALEALDKANNASEKTDEFGSLFEDVNEIANQAKAIAESATVSAEAIRQEAVATANQALSDVSDAIDGLDATVEEAKNLINDADSKAQSAVDGLNTLKEDMKPLAEWKGDKGSSFAGFVAQAKDDSAKLADLVTWQGDNKGSIESIAGIERKVSDNEAVLNTVASYKKDDVTGFAGLIAQVDKNKSELSTLASYKHTDENGNVISSGLAGLIQQVDANASSIKLLVGFEDEEVDSLGQISVRVGKNESDISLLASWKTDAASTIASTKTLAEKNEASITDLTNADTELKDSISQIKQQSDENGASIELMVSSVDKYSVGEYSQAYGLTRDQAKSILKPGYIYVPTDNFDKCCNHHSSVGTHCETFVKEATSENFTPGNYYTWNGSDWIESQPNSVVFSQNKPTGTTYKYWYINSSTAPTGYEPYALYTYEDNEWKKVNILAGNSSNRAVSMIRQTTDKITIDVSNTKKDVSSLQQWIDNNSANIQTVVSWRSQVKDNVDNIATIKQTADNAGASISQIVSNIGSNGKVTAASIVTAINKDTSSITLNASKINLNGVVTANNNVQITTDGKIIANDGTFTGTINANEGRIGGWSIDETYIRTQVKGTLNSFSLFSAAHSSAILWIQAMNNSGDTTFSVSKEGYLNAKKAVIDGDSRFTGTITAKDGQIGNLTLSNNKLFGSSTGTYVFTSGINTKFNSAKNSTIFLWAGSRLDKSTPQDTVKEIYGGDDWTEAKNTIENKAKFYVTHMGELHATGAVISGRIQVEKNGVVGGWHIDNTYIDSRDDSTGRRFYLASVNDADGNWIVAKNSGGITFQVSKSGYLTCTGATVTGYITATGGSFTGTINASDGTFTGTVNAKYGNFANGVTIGGTSITAGHLRQLYNGAIGNTGSNTIQITRVEANRGSIGGWGIWDGYLYNTTRSGMAIGGISGYGDVRLSPSVVTAYFYTSRTASTAYSSIQEYWYNIAKAGREYANSVSDLRAKNSIDEFNDNYEVLFDSLSPKRYKYNDGESNRYHTGFVAQEVVDAINRSGLTTQDFAAVCLEGKDEDLGYWWLRRDEFVALNTWQIQKLKARVAELEEKIKRLEV